jgi:hypothetical protein
MTWNHSFDMIYDFILRNLVSVFEVLTEVTMKMYVSWDMTPCILVDVYHIFNLKV